MGNAPGSIDVTTNYNPLRINSVKRCEVRGYYGQPSYGYYGQPGYGYYGGPRVGVGPFSFGW